MSETIHKGSCLCGAVTIEVAGDLPAPDACHCSLCRKQSGHYWASTDVPSTALTISGEDHVRWYQSSEKVRRGFCDSCGASLFWDPIHHDKIAIAMGLFDESTDTRLWSHIFVADKGDYYEIESGVLQKDQ
ncbi:GFA family protein [Parasphingorhabdus sp.]|jgi:hypothetical protein|uniref:GFA family protein n=1 Tax=Parasphingorhabdus sp. TaxID=2709688 RepID=UPI003D288971